MFRPLFLFALLGFLLSPQARAGGHDQTPWKVSVTQSALAFTATQMGTPFSGTIGKFDADILFDPEHLAGGRVEVDIDLFSIGTGDSDRDRTLALAEWFDLGHFPVARFVANTFKKTENGFEASGTLTIKGKTVPVILPFTLEISPTTVGRKAQMKGVCKMNRADFALGTGEWADFGVIANEVEVRVDLVAYQTFPKK